MFEELVLRAELAQLKGDLAKANAELDKFRGAQKKGQDALNASAQSAGRNIVSISQVSRQSMERTITAAERRLAGLRSEASKIAIGRRQELDRVSGDSVRVERLKAIHGEEDTVRQERELDAVRRQALGRIESLQSAEERLAATRRREIDAGSGNAAFQTELAQLHADEERIRKQQEINREVEREKSLREQMLERTRADAARARTPLQRAVSRRDTEITAFRGEAAALRELETLHERLIAVEKRRQALQTAEAFNRFGRAATFGVTIPLTAAAAAALKLDQDFRKAETALTRMLGSAAGARHLLGDLETFAARTPFEFSELIPQAQRLKALGFEASRIIPILTDVGDAVAGVGGDSQTLDRITLALGQIQSKGRVMAQEMNQLTESLVPAWEILASRIGVSVPEAMKLVEKGAVRSSVAIPAILAGMADRFGGTMEQLNQTLSGQTSNLLDELKGVGRDFGGTLEPAAKGIVKSARDIVAGFREISPEARGAAVGVAAFAAVIPPLALAVGGLTKAWALLLPVLAANPWILLAGGIIGVAAALYEASQAAKQEGAELDALVAKTRAAVGITKEHAVMSAKRVEQVERETEAFRAQITARERLIGVEQPNVARSEQEISQLTEAYRAQLIVRQQLAEAPESVPGDAAHRRDEVEKLTRAFREQLNERQKLAKVPESKLDSSRHAREERLTQAYREQLIVRSQLAKVPRQTADDAGRVAGVERLTQAFREQLDQRYKLAQAPEQTIDAARQKAEVEQLTAAYRDQLEIRYDLAAAPPVAGAVTPEQFSSLTSFLEVYERGIFLRDELAKAPKRLGGGDSARRTEAERLTQAFREQLAERQKLAKAPESKLDAGRQQGDVDRLTDAYREQLEVRYRLASVALPVSNAETLRRSEESLTDALEKQIDARERLLQIERQQFLDDTRAQPLETQGARLPFDPISSLRNILKTETGAGRGGFVSDLDSLLGRTRGAVGLGDDARETGTVSGGRLAIPSPRLEPGGPTGESIRQAKQKAAGDTGPSSELDKLRQAEERSADILNRVRTQELSGVARVAEEYRLLREELGKTATARRNLAEAEQLALAGVRADAAAEALKRETAIAEQEIKNRAAAELRALDGVAVASIDAAVRVEQQRAEIEIRAARETSALRIGLIDAEAARRAQANIDTGEELLRIESEWLQERKAEAIRTEEEIAAVREAAVNRAGDLLKQQQLQVRTAEMANAREAIALGEIGLAASRDAQLRGIEALNAITVEQKIAVERRKAEIEQDFLQRSIELKRELLEKDKQIEIAQAEGKESAIQEIRERYLLQNQRLDLESNAALTAVRENAAIRSGQILVDENEKALNTLQRQAEGVFDAMIRTWRDGWSGAAAFFQTVLLTAIKNIVTAQITRTLAGILNNGGSGGGTPGFAGGPGGGGLGGGLSGILSSVLGLGGLGGGVQVFGQGSILGGPGGTPGFGGAVRVGPASTVASAAGAVIPTVFDIPGLSGGATSGAAGQVAQQAGILASLKGIGSQFKGILTNLGNIGSKQFAGGINGLAGGALLAGGGILALNGIRQGGVKGLLQTTAGGALIGAKFGGPIGAAIGGGIGAVVGLIGLFRKSAEQKIVEAVDKRYGVKIPKSFAKDPLLGIIQSQFGGNIGVGISSPQIRELIELYAMSTGQNTGKIPLPSLPTTFANRGGVLQEVPTLRNGQEIFASTTGNSGSGAAVSTAPATVVVESLQVTVGDQGAGAYFDGRATDAIRTNSRVVAQSALNGQRQNVGRRQSAALAIQPNRRVA